MPMNFNQPKRRNFNLRTMFAAVTLLSVSLGWLGMQFKGSHDRADALHWVQDLQARQKAVVSGDSIPPRKGAYVTRASSKAPWFLSLLGERGVEELVIEQKYLIPETRYSLPALKRLFPEAEVRVVVDSHHSESDGTEHLIRE